MKELSETALTLLRLEDGRVVPYSKERISSQLVAAAQAVGDTDPLWPTEVAEAVSVYLRIHTTSGVLTERQLESAVVKTLLRTNHIAMAKAYVLYRSQQRLEQSSLLGSGESNFQLDMVTGGDTSLLVRDLSGELIRWSRPSRVSALVSASGLAIPLAEQLVIEVEQSFRESGLIPAPVQTVLYLCARKLFELGVTEPKSTEQISLPGLLVTPLFHRGAAASQSPLDAGMLTNRYLSGFTSLVLHHPKEAGLAHYSGDIAIDKPWAINRFLSGSIVAEELVSQLRLLSPYFTELELVTPTKPTEPIEPLLRLWNHNETSLTLTTSVDGAASEMLRQVDGGELEQVWELPADLTQDELERLLTELPERKLCFRFSGRSNTTEGGFPDSTVLSRVFINLRRLGAAGPVGAVEVGVSAIRNALRAAEGKREFFRHLISLRNNGVLKGLLACHSAEQVQQAANSVELVLVGLEQAVYEITAAWPWDDSESAEFLKTTAEQLCGAARRLAREDGFELTLRTCCHEQTKESFYRLDQVVLKLSEPPIPPPFALPGGGDACFKGSWLPAWPEDIAVELSVNSDSPAVQAKNILLALSLGAERVHLHG